MARQWHENLPRTRRARTRRRQSWTAAIAITLASLGLGAWAIGTVALTPIEVHCDHPEWEYVDYAVVAATCKTIDGSPVRVHLID